MEFIILCERALTAANVGSFTTYRGDCSISIFLFEFSGNAGRNIFLMSIVSRKIFQPYFQKSRLEYYFCVSFTFRVPILDI